VRDWDAKRASSDVIARLLATKSPLIAHLSWVCLWLGFHTLLVYCHNDSVTALGSSDLQILITPILAQGDQSASGVSSSGFSLFSPNSNVSQAFLSISDADLLVHHALALGIHTTVLILLKGSLDSRGTAMVPDKAHMGFGFPCDGPGRGGVLVIFQLGIHFI
jgi:photosystem I P700 chlorophyll a apoprotein A2